jgi:hypothetical protein
VTQATVSRVNPWIVIALVVAVILLLMTALMLVAEPGMLHAIRSTLLGPQQVDCGGSVGTHC